MRKIGILTLYNSDYGSYYQAVSLYDQLEKLGYECEIINILNRERRVIYNLVGAMVSRILPFIAKRISRRIDVYNTYMILKKSLKNYKVSKVRFSMKKITKEYDCVVLGADELWSAMNPYVQYIRTYYGHHITCPHISYATSGISLGTPDEKIMRKIKQDLNTFDSLGVRDDFTKSWVENLTGKKCTKVIDPTLLNPFFIVKENEEEKYILVYGETFSPEAIKAITNFAAEKGLGIKSVSWKHDWCEFLETDSAEGLEIAFSKACYCMTSTFHGTIFSVLNEKNFVSFDTNHRGKKVKELLKEIGLENRLYKSGSIMEQTIDYNIVNQRLDILRQDSLEYLRTSLNQIEGVNNSEGNM